LSPGHEAEKQGQKGIQRRQNAYATKRCQKEVARFAKPQGQAREEISELEPVMWSSEQKDRDNRNL
jgi:hypothetical protein